MFRFKYPLVFILLPLVIYIGFLLYKRLFSKNRGLHYSSFLIDLAPKNYKHYLYTFTYFLPFVALVIMVFALARPQIGEGYEKQETMGIDIMLCLDTSSSMKALDFKPKNRFEVAKKTTLDFVKKRKYDRIGFIAFAGYAITKCPLTTDKRMLEKIIKDTKLDSIEDGTAIGMAIATAVNRLRKSKAKTKVIILLTDGVNNRGVIDPLTAAKLAKELGIKIYSIGIGTNGFAEIPQKNAFGMETYVKVPVEIDEALLTKVSRMTGGEYFRATDSKKLQTIYSIIDSLEKTKIEVKRFTVWKDKYYPLLLTALILLLGYIVLNNIVLRVKE